MEYLVVKHRVIVRVIDILKFLEGLIKLLHYITD